LSEPEFSLAERPDRLAVDLDVGDEENLRPDAHGSAPFFSASLARMRAASAASVLTPTFRYHPAVVAQAFGTLGVMFPDRIVLGVGTGE
jgi:Luciferase-like monooxygenase